MKRLIQVLLTVLWLTGPIILNGAQAAPKNQKADDALWDLLRRSSEGAKVTNRELKNLLAQRANHQMVHKGYSMNPLAEACRQGILPYVQLLIEHQQKMDASKLAEYVTEAHCPATRLPLVSVCESEASRAKPDDLFAIMRMLLNAKADLKAQCTERGDHGRDLNAFCYVLTQAKPIDETHSKIVELMIKAQPTIVNQPDCQQTWYDYTVSYDDPKFLKSKNITPLMHAVEAAYKYEERRYHEEGDKYKPQPNPFVPLVAMLLENGADATLQDYQGKTALSRAPFQGPNKDMVEDMHALLRGLPHQSLINRMCFKDKYLPVACVVTEYLYERDINQRMLNLVEKTTKETEEAACIELQKLFVGGANPNSCNANGKTALMYAAQYGNAQLVKMLLGHPAQPADTCAQDNGGKTAVMYAAEGGYPQIVKMLLDATEVDLRKPLVDAQTVVFRPGYLGKSNYVKRIRPGADEPAQRRGRYVSHRTRGDEEPKVEVSTEIVGQTALHIAATKGDEAIVAMLLQAAANIELKDTAKKTAREYAANDAVRKLLEVGN